MPTTIQHADFAPPLRVLCLMANPSDLPHYDDAALRNDITAAMRPLMASDAAILEHVSEPTEIGLNRCLAQNSWHVLHLVVHCEAQASANYGSIALNSSTGKARKLTAPYVAGLIARCPSIRFVILQPADEASQGLETIAKVLSEQVPTVLSMPAIQRKAVQIFVSKLYNGLLAGLNADAVLQEILRPLLKEGVAAGAIRILSRDSSDPIFSTLARTKSTEPERVDAPQEEHTTASSARHEQLNQKRKLGQFDVFLCHNVVDKPAVKRIAQRLKEAGILPWLDVWELPPGVPWQPLLEKQIDKARKRQAEITAQMSTKIKQLELHRARFCKLAEGMK